MKKDQRTQAQEPFQNDVRSRLDELEKALELHKRLINDLTSRLQSVQKRLQIAVFVVILSLIVSLVAIGMAVFR